MVTDNTTHTSILLLASAALIPGVVSLFVLHLEPDSNRGRIFESVEVGRERAFQT
jgi:hypothetical protein